MDFGWQGGGKRWKGKGIDYLILPAYKDPPKQKGNICDHCPSQGQLGMTKKQDLG